jgi:hypothetical protein
MRRGRLRGVGEVAGRGLVGRGWGRGRGSGGGGPQVVQRSRWVGAVVERRYLACLVRMSPLSGINSYHSISTTGLCSLSRPSSTPRPSSHTISSYSILPSCAPAPCCVPSSVPFHTIFSYHCYCKSKSRRIFWLFKKSYLNRRSF